MSNQVIIEVLKNAKALIDTPDKWCQGQMHRYSDGAEGVPCQRCALGALVDADVRVRGVGVMDETYALAKGALSATVSKLTDGAYSAIPHFNDANGRTHGEVLNLFTLTIAKLEEEDEQATN